MTFGRAPTLILCCDFLPLFGWAERCTIWANARHAKKQTTFSIILFLFQFLSQKPSILMKLKMYVDFLLIRSVSVWCWCWWGCRCSWSWWWWWGGGRRNTMKIVKMMRMTRTRTRTRTTTHTRVRKEKEGRKEGTREGEKDRKMEVRERKWPEHASIALAAITFVFTTLLTAILRWPAGQ